MTRVTRPPAFVWVVVAVILLGLVVVAVAAWGVHQIDEVGARRDCARVVAARDDARAMWLYAIDAADDPHDPKVVEFTKKLDELLPPLRCEGGTWVPANDAG